MQIIFLSGTKCLRLPQYVNKFLVWHKKFGPAKNFLRPVKGQGIRVLFVHMAKRGLSNEQLSTSSCPRSYGMTTSIQNPLQLLCSNHNNYFWSYLNVFMYFQCSIFKWKIGKISLNRVFSKFSKFEQ